jgi:hypothetical protein
LRVPVKLQVPCSRAQAGRAKVSAPTVKVRSVVCAAAGRHTRAVVNAPIIAPVIAPVIAPMTAAGASAVGRGDAATRASGDGARSIMGDAPSGPAAAGLWFDERDAVSDGAAAPSWRRNRCE